MLNRTSPAWTALFTLALVLLGGLTAPAADPEPSRIVPLPGTATAIRLAPDGTYQLSRDKGLTYSRSLPRQDEIVLQDARFDPLVSGSIPEFPRSLAADPTGQSFIVQFITPPLPEFRAAIRRLGGTTHQYLPRQALLVRIAPERLDLLRQLPFVRWVGPWHPAYRLEKGLRLRLAAPSGNDRPAAGEPLRCWVMVLERGPALQELVADRIAALGGVVEKTTPQGFRLLARLTDRQLLSVARMDEVLFIDRWSPPEADMNIVRQISGADEVEAVSGYSGEGVRGEAMDGGLLTTHQDFQARPPILHGSNSSDPYHGSQVYGICFGDGTGDADARGLLPDGQGIFASYWYLGNRYTHTAELVDPEGEYRVVFQTNSWGDSQTTNYTSSSAEMDDILFLNDLVITQSQSNMGSRFSRPQAWAKNIISVGGVYHYNTLTRNDDSWSWGASIGPADDGRIKPDLCHFYDDTWTTGYSHDAHYTDFGGTSGATPITAGHFGLLFQMWADGIFTGNPGSGGEVFDSRPHMTTAKALMINTASPYEFSGSGHDLTRVHQGWGLAHVGQLHQQAEESNWRLPLVVDESEIIEPLAVHRYGLHVPSGDAWFKATLVYADPMGNPGAGEARINDLTLKATSPGGTVYWGNNGLLEANWSAPGGAANTVDTVENIFVELAEPGQWQLEVLADEIIEDSHPETAALDADYALVVTGPVQVGGLSRPVLIVAPGPGAENPTAVRGYGVDGAITGVTDFTAYPELAGFGTRLASGNLLGEPYEAIITGPGPGPAHPPRVRAFAADGTPHDGVDLIAYGALKFGVNVACGDIDADGLDEIITGAGPGAVFGPHVRGWDVSGGTAAAMPAVSFLAYGTNRWGVNVACADLDGDGADEILSGAGPGAVFGPHVRGWNYDGATLSPIPAVSFFAYGTNRWGVNVAGADIDGDGVDEILTGAGPGSLFGPHVRGWNYDGTALNSIPAVSFFAYGTDKWGVNVTGADVDGDGIDEIITAPGPGGSFVGHLRGWNYDGETLSAIGTLNFIAFSEEGYRYGATLTVARLE